MVPQRSACVEVSGAGVGSLVVVKCLGAGSSQVFEFTRSTPADSIALNRHT